MRLRSDGIAVLALALGTACHAPERPYGQPSFDVAENDSGTAASRGAARTLVVGAIDDETVQPIGGFYNGEHGLAATYFYSTLAEKLRDELQASVVARGIRCFKDSLDQGAPVPFARGPRGQVVLRGRVVSFGYSRLAPEKMDELRGSFDLCLVEGSTGDVLWRGEARVGVSVPAIPGERNHDGAFVPAGDDPFARFTDALAGHLLDDPAFARCLSGAAR